ncbi:hypothetical protein UFOVP181_80 [uncultured Caudovirales phage]|uniref:Uncharacterized protein n=1 Tax=uncultured Caudovirales phage TaxID=2100421 RepID=A0A6J7WGR4_9CAUD|nr:hypothetical protein UFOVP57_82 [uncultured Caudovirales phage]CAB5208591.1 hypothetical protein UFOVP181_80 [uncultured Caudovirales phage]
MPSLIGTPTAANYRQQIVPFSRFGTRKVAWYKIGSADVADGGGVLDMAAFNTVIDCIQTRAEIVMVGAPYIVNDTGWNKFMVAVFEDTFNNGNDTDPEGVYTDNSMATTLQDALRAATDNGGIYVERFYLYGAPAGGHDNSDGWSSNNTYQEYATKAEFVTGYTS